MIGKWFYQRGVTKEQINKLWRIIPVNSRQFSGIGGGGYHDLFVLDTNEMIYLYWILMKWFVYDLFVWIAHPIEVVNIHCCSHCVYRLGGGV